MVLKRTQKDFNVRLQRERIRMRYRLRMDIDRLLALWNTYRVEHCLNLADGCAVQLLKVEHEMEEHVGEYRV